MPDLADQSGQWPVATSRVAYDGGGWVVRVREDRIRRPGHPEEEPFTRLVVEHPGAAIILAVDDRDRVLCVWQYRHAVAQTLVQLPAGLCDVDGEDAAEVARRELAEEAGLEAQEWTHLASTYSSPGFSAERSHFFLARDLRGVGDEGQRAHPHALHAGGGNCRALQHGYRAGDTRRACPLGEGGSRGGEQQDGPE